MNKLELLEEELKKARGEIEALKLQLRNVLLLLSKEMEVNGSALKKSPPADDAAIKTRSGPASRGEVWYR